jgi:NADPH:quinone reductase-like Zn-dependent oxidoreductase
LLVAGGFADNVLEATDGNGVDLAADLIVGSAFPDCLRSLSNQGRLVVVGDLDDKLKAEIDLAAVHGRRS